MEHVSRQEGMSLLCDILREINIYMYLFINEDEKILFLYSGLTVDWIWRSTENTEISK